MKVRSEALFFLYHNPCGFSKYYCIVIELSLQQPTSYILNAQKRGMVIIFFPKY